MHARIASHSFSPSHFPTHYYLFNIFGYISHQIALVGKETPFEFFDIEQKYIAGFLHFSYLIFLVVSGSVSYPNVFRLKTSYDRQTVEADFLGELRFPILYDTILFIPQVCLLSMTETVFLRTIASLCSAVNDSLSATTPNQADIALVNFINTICSFVRFGSPDQPVTDDLFLRSFRANIKKIPPVVSLANDVLEYIAYAETHFTARVLNEEIDPTIHKPFEPIPLVFFRSTDVSRQNDSHKPQIRTDAFPKVNAKMPTPIYNALFSVDTTQRTHKSSTPNTSDLYASIETRTQPTYASLKVIATIESIALLREQQNIMSCGKSDAFDERDEKATGVLLDPFFPHVNKSFEQEFHEVFFDSALISPLFKGHFDSFEQYCFPQLFPSLINPLLRSKIERLIEHNLFELSILNKKSKITDTNYAVVLRHIWLRVVFHDYAMVVKAPHFVKLLATCYGHLFVDVFLFIPENVVSDLFATVCQLLEGLETKTKSALYYFVKVLLLNLKTAFFFFDFPKKIPRLPKEKTPPNVSLFRFSKETNDVLQNALKHPKVKPFLKKFM